jgi:hypothetical protein
MAVFWFFGYFVIFPPRFRFLLFGRHSSKRADDEAIGAGQ